MLESFNVTGQDHLFFPHPWIEPDAKYRYFEWEWMHVQ